MKAFVTFLSLFLFFGASAADEVNLGNLLERDERLRFNSEGEKQCKIVLSFDDGPRPDRTEILSKFALDNNLPISLFMLGKEVEKAENAEIMANIVGNRAVFVSHHSQTHPKFSKVSSNTLTQSELAPLCRYIRTSDGSPYTLNGKTIDQINVEEEISAARRGYAYFAQQVLFQGGDFTCRFPYGDAHDNQRVLGCVASMGMNPQCIMWNADIKDFQIANNRDANGTLPKSQQLNPDQRKRKIAEKIVDEIVNKCQEDGDEVVFVLHDNQHSTVNAITQDFLPLLRKEYSENGRLRQNDVALEFLFSHEISPSSNTLRFASEELKDRYEERHRAISSKPVAVEAPAAP